MQRRGAACQGLELPSLVFLFELREQLPTKVGQPANACASSRERDSARLQGNSRSEKGHPYRERLVTHSVLHRFLNVPVAIAWVGGVQGLGRPLGIPDAN